MPMRPIVCLCSCLQLYNRVRCEDYITKFEQDENPGRDPRERPQVHHMGQFLGHVPPYTIRIIILWTQITVLKDDVVRADVFWVIRSPELDLKHTGRGVVSTVKK
ncbi:hypothetical protein LSAT2_031254 [Lamellibrachia satsuma]|nr:hypothetical protein LSAT2_031254 [Lamellibrachia satsuma]